MISGPVSISVPTAKAWASLGEYLQRSETHLLPESVRHQLRGEWEQVQRLEQSLEDAILIGLVGGTGVGKSTFINALAGEVISQSSDRRPTTSRVVVYRNVTCELPHEVPTANLSQPQVLHRRENLTKTILLDFPDFDSVEATHADILEGFLPHLDVLFIVVDDVKYADRRLYDLLSRLKHDDDNMYVLLNKIDRLAHRYGEDQVPTVVQEIQQDLGKKLDQFAGLSVSSEQMFAIAAKQVLDSRVAEPTAAVAPGFQQIESLLGKYQRDKHRRAAKEKNIDARQLALVKAIRDSALADENRSVIHESQQLIADWRAEMEHAMAEIPAELLHEPERRHLRVSSMRRSGSQWGLPTSLFVTLLTEFSRWRGGGNGAQINEMGARVNAHYLGFFESLSNLRARIKSELTGTSLAGELTGKRIQDGVVESRQAVTNRLGQEFCREVVVPPEKPRATRRLVCHLPALIVFGLAVWTRLYPILSSLTGVSEDGVLSTTIWAFVASLNPTFIVAC